MKKRYSMDWIPLWTDKWLFGSTAVELTLEEQAVWIKLLCLASKDDGWIRANENTPYPLPIMAGLLQCPVNVLEKTIEKCIKLDKIEENKNILGIFKIKNWEKYQISSRHKRRLYNPDENNEQEKVKEPKIIFNFEQARWENITEQDIIRWKDTYPAVDIKFELKRMTDWLLSNPEKKKSNYRKFISNWLSRTQDEGGSKNATAIKTTLDEPIICKKCGARYWTKKQECSRCGEKFNEEV